MNKTRFTRFLADIAITAGIAFSCSSTEHRDASKTNIDSLESVKKETCCMPKSPGRFVQDNGDSIMVSENYKNSAYAGMVKIPGGTFMMGGNNDQASPDEFPRHKVTVDGFRMDATEVTNRQFAEFVEATGYLTTAELKPDWEELKKDLPPGTPKPDENHA
jgi:formylglycine-generating enzyme